MQVAFINTSWCLGGGGGVVLRRSKSASHRHNQLQLGLSKQKHKDRQAIPSSPPFTRHAGEAGGCFASSSSPLLYYSLVYYSLTLLVSYPTILYSTGRLLDYSLALLFLTRLVSDSAILLLYYSLTLLFLSQRTRSYIESFSSKLPLIMYNIVWWLACCVAMRCVMKFELHWHQTLYSRHLWPFDTRHIVHEQRFRLETCCY